MKKILEKIHGFTGAIEHATVFVDAVIAGFKAYTAKMNEFASKKQADTEETA